MFDKKLDWRRFVGLMIVGTFVVGAVSCAPPQVAAPQPVAPTEAPPPRTSAVYAASADPVTFDPQKCAGGACIDAYEHVYEGLTRFDRNANVEPCLAESWENPDPLTWIFNLRQGVKFHNGEELTADDVKFSIDRVLDPETGSSYKSFFDAITEVTVVDKYTIQLTLSKPFVAILAHFATERGGGSIVNKAWAEEQLAGGVTELASVAVGTGPYKLVEYVPGDYFKLEKHEDYWEEGKPKIDDVTWKVILDTTARVEALRAGTIDFAQLDAESVKLLEDAENVTTYTVAGTGMPVLIFNMRREPWSDKRVRQAVAMGTDRQEVINKAWGGQGFLTGPVMTGWGDWYIPVEELPYEVDIEGAKALLAEAGYPDGFETDLLGLDMSPYADVGVVAQAQLEKIGIKTNLKQTEFGAWLDLIQAFDYEVHVNGYGFGIDPDAVLGRSYICDSEGNFPGYCNPEYDELRDQELAESDPAKRTEILLEMQRILVDDAPMIWYGTMNDFYATSKRLQGYEPSFTPQRREPMKDVYVE